MFSAWIILSKIGGGVVSLLSNKWVLIVLSVAAFGIIGYYSVNKLTKAAVEDYKEELLVDNLKEHIKQVEKDKKFAEKQVEEARQQRDIFIEAMKKQNVRVDQSQAKIKKGLQDGSLQDGKIPSVSLATMDELDRLSKEVAQ